MTSTKAEASAAGPTIDSEITWLLHRAAQRMHAVTGEHAERHGLQLRDYIVLSALELTPGLTQVELARTLGLDKTTLMTQLDGLERKLLIVRRPSPHDRRARIPEITEAGSGLRTQVSDACIQAEAESLQAFSEADIGLLRNMLLTIIGDSTDPGSCI